MEYSAQGTGGLLSPRDPFAQVAATSSARCLAFLTLKRAHTRPYTILRLAVKSPSDAGSLALISGRLRGTFPLGLPECIRQTALPSVRGPHLRSRLRRGCCWSATFCLKVLQHPHPVPIFIGNRAIFIYFLYHLFRDYPTGEARCGSCPAAFRFPGGRPGSDNIHYGNRKAGRFSPESFRSNLKADRPVRS